MNLQELLTPDETEEEPIEVEVVPSFADRVRMVLLKLWPEIDFPEITVTTHQGPLWTVEQAVFEVSDGITCSVVEEEDSGEFQFVFNDAIDYSVDVVYYRDPSEDEISLAQTQFQRVYKWAVEKKALEDRKNKWLESVPICPYEGAQPFGGPHAGLMLVVDYDHLGLRVHSEYNAALTIELELDDHLFDLLEAMLYGYPWVYGSNMFEALEDVAQGERILAFVAPAKPIDDSSYTSVWVRLHHQQASELGVTVSNLLAYYRQLLKWAERFALEFNVSVDAAVQFAAPAA